MLMLTCSTRGVSIGGILGERLLDLRHYGDDQRLDDRFDVGVVRIHLPLLLYLELHYINESCFFHL